MNYFSHNEALDFLEGFIKNKVKDKYYLNKLDDIISECRKERTVTIRAINECFFEYRERFHDYEAFTEEERDKWDGILSSWQ